MVRENNGWKKAEGSKEGTPFPIPPPHHEWMEGGRRQEHYEEMVHSSYDKEIDTYSGIRLGIMESSFTIEQKLYCVLLTEKKMHNLKVESYVLFGGQN